MDIHCNAGVTSTNLVGDLPGYGEVWFNPNGIANILSLSRVKQRGFRVTFDSENGNEFHVHKPNGTTRVFQQSNRGLYYMDTQATGITLINTVEGNKSNFTNRDYSRAMLARKVQNIIGRPSDRTFIKIVDDRLIRDCPITRRDISIADAILGTDLGSQGRPYDAAHFESKQLLPISQLPLCLTIENWCWEATLCLSIVCHFS
jgi:hypothetical protein